MQNKALDFVILNDATEPGAGFEVTTNRVTILDATVRKSTCRCCPSATWPNESSTWWKKRFD